MAFFATFVLSGAILGIIGLSYPYFYFIILPLFFSVLVLDILFKGLPQLRIKFSENF